jgi:tRNA(Arg) A34 adenosine deaminase TadA
MSKRIYKQFDRAAQEAIQSDMPFKHGAVVVCGGKVISTGFNSTRTRLNKKNICSVHAEILALSRLVQQQSYEKGSKEQEKDTKL